MSRALGRIAIAALVVLLAFIVLIGPGLLAAPIALFIGWVFSVARLLRSWHPSARSVLLFALATILLVAGTHGFMRWLYSFPKRKEDSRLPSDWPWKWTLCGYGMTFCTLVAVGSLVLTTHQLYWLSKASDPLFTDPIRERLPSLVAARTLQNLAEEARWDIVKTRAAFWQQASAAGGQPAMETLQAVWIEQDGGRLRAVVLIPRRPLHRTRARVMVVQPGTNLVTRNLDELPQVLASFGIGNIARASKTPVPLLP